MNEGKTIRDLALMLPFSERNLGRVKDIAESKLLFLEMSSLDIIHLVRAIGEAAAQNNLCPIDLAYGMRIETRENSSEGLMKSLVELCHLSKLEPIVVYSDRPSKQDRRARQREYRQNERNRNFKK